MRHVVLSLQCDVRKVQVFCSASATDISIWDTKHEYNNNIIYAQCAHFCYILAKLTIMLQRKKTTRWGLLRCPDSTEPHQFDPTNVKIGYLSAYEKWTVGSMCAFHCARFCFDFAGTTPKRRTLLTKARSVVDWQITKIGSDEIQKLRCIVGHTELSTQSMPALLLFQPLTIVALGRAIGRQFWILHSVRNLSSS